MKQDELFQFLLSEAEVPFSGWDFSYIEGTGRMDSEPLPWSFASEILVRLRQVDSLLDMGTGGGEFLSMLRPLPKDTRATEGYVPNVQMARNRLEPLGVKVYEIDGDEHLPFADESFDLVMNRHESFSEKEVFRILKPGGLFATQQVGGTDNLDLNLHLGAKADFGFADWHLKTAVSRLENAGFQIRKQEEAYPKSRFYDVGAIVYYLKTVPWQIPDFSVASYFQRLKAVHRIIEQEGFFEAASHRFLILAGKGL